MTEVPIDPTEATTRASDTQPWASPATLGTDGVSSRSGSIIWTKVDEAPQLASHSLLPIVKAFCSHAGIAVEVADISLAGRILAQFPEVLGDSARPDDLTRLGHLSECGDANIIKLPNISASVPQLMAAICELQEHGFAIPNYPDNPVTDQERDIAARYTAVLGSAVNPVLRQGNSDRRLPQAVKSFAKAHPHRLGEWTADNPCRVVSMSDGDFYAHEVSVVIDAPTSARIEFLANDGAEPVQLGSTLEFETGEIVDTTFMSVAKLDEFFATEMAAAKRDNLVASVHLKATMMKVSDPVMFGHCVRTLIQPMLDKWADQCGELGINPALGLGDMISAIDQASPDVRDQMKADLDACLSAGPALAMIDSDRGISHLHAPNLLIIDASMPLVVRDSGQMWNADGKLQPVVAMIPDRCYGPMYRAVIDDCKAHGKLDPATMGSVSNVGLMAKKAEEYGSHPTTFIMEQAGTVRVITDDAKVLTTHDVEAGDIWRMSRAKDLPIREWVKLAVQRSKISDSPAIFFLDQNRPHDANMISKVTRYLGECDLDGVEVEILPPVEAVTMCLDRARQGKDSISVTGNVLRDYLTDLFPILEVGTSAKMLSIVPLLAGGGMYETGAGGSAPKHVQQFVAENYLRWDSLGEFCALQASLEQEARLHHNRKAAVLAATLDRAVTTFLAENKSPARRLGQIDNRGSHFYLALYWAEELAAQSQDEALATHFATVAQRIRNQEEEIATELIQAQGVPVDMGGYYDPDDAKVAAAMRPSQEWNRIVAGIGKAAGPATCAGGC